MCLSVACWEQVSGWLKTWFIEARCWQNSLITPQISSDELSPLNQSQPHNKIYLIYSLCTEYLRIYMIFCILLFALTRVHARCLISPVLSPHWFVSLVHKNEGPCFRMYRGELDIRGICLLIQSDPFGDGPLLTILIGLWLPVDNGVENKGKRRTTVDEKQSQSPLTVISSPMLAFIQLEPLIKSLKNIYLKKIPSW